MGNDIPDYTNLKADMQGMQRFFKDGNVQINAKDSETLSGASLSTTLVSSDTEIPSSKAVFDSLSEKSAVKLVSWTSADMI